MTTDGPPTAQIYRRAMPWYVLRQKRIDSLERCPRHGHPYPSPAKRLSLRKMNVQHVLYVHAALLLSIYLQELFGFNTV